MNYELVLINNEELFISLKLCAASREHFFTLRKKNSCESWGLCANSGSTTGRGV